MTDYDRMIEIRAFDESKSGVKGLVDAGITAIPRFFYQPSDTLRTATPDLDASTDPLFEIPVIDLRFASESRRDEIVDEVRRASETLGFFQVLNHGIPSAVLDEMVEGVRRFNEQDVEVKKRYYSRDSDKKVKFYSNFDLYQALTANWRDSVFCLMAPHPPVPEEFPLACREIALEYSNHVKNLGTLLFGLLSEALGLDAAHLESLDCAEGHALVLNYHPPCPEPNLTLGTSKHSDPDFLTILLQDQIGGLQVLHQHQWVDVVPIPGALVVNIGDLLQLVSNGKFRSVEHRVLASNLGPRVSVACFFTMHLSANSRRYGPIKKLLSEQSPPLYREILLREFIEHYESKGLDGQSALDYFKL